MNVFLPVRRSMERLYARHATVIRILIKFLFALVTFFFIRNVTGFSALASNLFVILILALLCSILPYKGTVVIAAILIAAQSLALGYDIGAAVCALMLLLVLLFLRFTPDDTPVAILQTMAMAFLIPSSAAIGSGLRRSASSAFSIAAGVITYYLLRALSILPGMVTETRQSEYLERLMIFMRSLFGQTELVIQVFVLCGVTVLVYAIRRQAFRNAYYTAAFTGTAVYLVFYIAASLFVGNRVNFVQVILGALISLAISIVAAALLSTGDYKGSEYLHFEDDDYYYYVKAVPKIGAREDDPAFEERFEGFGEIEKKLEEKLDHL